jgi:hypothetical protein
MTLAELVEKLAPEVHTASASQRLVLIESAVRHGRADILPAMTRYAAEALAELKAARVRASDLRAAGADMMAGILDGYDEACSRAGLVDPEERVWLAGMRTAPERSPFLDRFDRVVLHALYDLNEAQFRLLQNLIERFPNGGTVMLFNNTANVRPTRFAEWTWQRFIQDDTLADKTFPEFLRNSVNRPVLERLFAFDQVDLPPLPPDDSIRLVEAPGRYREIEAIAAEVSDLLASGESPSEIAVIVRHIDAYGEMIDDVFSRYGIPHAFETGIPLVRIPFIKYWLALLDLVTGERSRAALSRVIASAYFEPRLSPRIDCERELTSFGYIDRRHLAASALAVRKNSPLTAELVRLEQRLDALEHATQSVASFVRDLGPAPALPKRDREAWEILCLELESVNGIAGSINFAGFRRIASEIAGLKTVARTGAEPLPAGLARVRVLTPQALGYRRWRWVFAPGLADGEFPARSFSNPLLPDTVIEKLQISIRPRRMLTSRDRSRREPLFLFTILDSASRRVTLSWPGRNLEGDTAYPSVYIGEIARHFEESPVISLDAAPPVRESGECLRAIAGVWRSGGLDDASAQQLLGEDVVRRVRLEAKAISRADIGAGALRMDTAWHPSELNALAACPFTFLARHRLKLRPDSTVDFEVPASEVGILAHAILRDFHAQPVPSNRPEALERMTAMIQRRLADVDVHGQGPYSIFDPGLWQIRRRQLVSALLEYVDFAVRDAVDGFETVTEYLDKPLPGAALGTALLGGKPDHVAIHRRGAVIDGIRIDDFKYSALSGATSKQL